MAGEKLPEILADLPEDWGYGQIVAPEGASVGLAPQYGYNYLMRRVNECAQVLNQVAAELGHTVPEDAVKLKGGGEMLLHGDFGAAPHTIDVEEDIPAAGARLVIGAAESGCTCASCDYLCDGTADDEEIQEALNALAGLGGGELLFLPGTYHLAGDVSLTKKSYDSCEAISLRGTGSEAARIMGPAQITGSGWSLSVCGLAFQNVALQYQENMLTRSSFEVRNCSFSADDPQALGPNARGLVYAYTSIVSVIGCEFFGSSPPSSTPLLRVHGDRVAVFYNRLASDGTMSGIFAGGVGVTCIGLNDLQQLDTAINANQGYITVIGNLIRSAGKGILAASGANCQAFSNRMEKIAQNGILTAAAAFGNVISGPNDSLAEIGVSLDCYNGIYAANNTVTGFTRGIAAYARSDGPTAKTSLAQISNNTISGCSTGISLENAERHLPDETIVPLYASCIRVFGNAVLGSTIASIKVESRCGSCLISQNLCPDAPIVDQGSGNTVSGNMVP